VGSVIAAATAVFFWAVWGGHRAPRWILFDILVLSFGGFVLAALARSARAARPDREPLAPAVSSVPAPVRVAWLSPALWTLSGGVLGAVAMGALAFAPGLLASFAIFAVAGYRADGGRRRKLVRGLAIVLVAALSNGLVLWSTLLSAYLPASPRTFRSREFYANEFLADVPVHDMWTVHLEGGGAGRTVRDVQAVMGTTSPWEANPSVIVLVAIRGLLGRVFGWDEKVEERAELSYLGRVSEDVLARSLQEPGREGGYFRLMYTLEDEMVAEILNRTAHAFLCMAIEPAGDGYTLYWVILVKEEMPLTPYYMGLIDPFRRYLVHPMIVRSIEQHWRHVYEDAR